MILTVGATLACGTGACAVVVAAVLEGRAERVCIFCFFLLFCSFTFIITKMRYMFFL